MSATDETTPRTVALSNSAPEHGRLSILSSFAAAASAIPLPIVPGKLVGRVRGAVVYDVATRHGLSLTTDGRKALAEVSGSVRVRALVKKAVLFATRRIFKRVGPLALIGVGVSAVEVFALGHLFERYVTELRPSGRVRVDVEEARLVRDAIDRAIARVMSPTLSARPAYLGAGGEDLRDEFTRWIDTLLLTGASMPGYLVRRLESAFDEITKETPGLGAVAQRSTTPRSQGRGG